MDKYLIEKDENLLLTYQHNPNLRESAYQSLYESPTVFYKIQHWLSRFRIQGYGTPDVMQDGMILLDKALSTGTFEGKCSIQTFFLAICFNLVRKGARQKYNQIQFKGNFTDADWNQTPEKFADHLILEEEEAAQTTLKKNLLERMQQLTDNCREALQLYYWESLNMKQIATIRFLKKGEAKPPTEEQLLAEAKQAKKTVHRCRESLRALL